MCMHIFVVYTSVGLALPLITVELLLQVLNYIIL